MHGLDDYYGGLEKRWTVEADGRLLADLVVPNGNGRAPVHRWFRMKEAYSCLLLDHVLTRHELAGASTLRVLDPYAGCGTTGVSLAQTRRASGASFFGLETNPFLHLIATAKLDALRNPPDDFDDFAQVVVAAAVRRNSTLDLERPALSTLNRSEYVTEEALDELLKLRQGIERHSEAASPEAVNLAELCLGAAIEPATKLRRDGRALRYAPEKRPARPAKEFLRRAQMVLDDIPREPILLDGHIALGDARSDSLSKEMNEIDLVLFSPPYPNNIDYTEVYKLELWLLGLVSDEEEFANQRRRTIRSHPSLKVNSPPFLHDCAHSPAVGEMIDAVSSFIPDGDRYSHSRRRTVEGYIRDMASSFGWLEEQMAPGASLVYVVGNSLHGGPGGESFLVAADVLLARLAETVGLTVERFEVARVPQRRAAASRFLRESLVSCRKPEDGSYGG